MSKTRKRHRLDCHTENILMLVLSFAFGSVFISGYLLLTTQDKFAEFPTSNPSAFYYEQYGIEILKPIPIGVMLENELLSRPFQRGLSSAQTVYEAPTEAGITRFMAIFPYDVAMPKVGPIRSVRPYYVDWIAEYKGALAHVGGSDEALNKLSRLEKEGQLINLDQFAFGNAFGRENVGKVSLEHTMFSTGERLRKAISKNIAIETSAENSFNPKVKNITPEGETSLGLEIDYGFKTYGVKYLYDEKTSRYMRFQAGAPHVDHNTNEQIGVRTIIVQEVDARSLGDDKFRISITTVSQGDAMILQNGKAYNARWEKTSIESPTRFFYENGAEVKVKSFPLWIEIVPKYNSYKTL